jgi:hypothetical protein
VLEKKSSINDTPMYIIVSNLIPSYMDINPTQHTHFCNSGLETLVKCETITIAMDFSQALSQEEFDALLFGN